MQEYWPAVAIAAALFVGAIAIGMWIESETGFVYGIRWTLRERRWTLRARRETRRILSPR